MVISDNGSCPVRDVLGPFHLRGSAVLIADSKNELCAANSVANDGNE